MSEYKIVIPLVVTQIIKLSVKQRKISDTDIQIKISKVMLNSNLYIVSPCIQLILGVVFIDTVQTVVR